MMNIRRFSIVALFVLLTSPCLADSVGDVRKQAEEGDVIAQYNLGYMYENGEDVPMDFKKAAYWYGKAAEQYDEDAKHNLKMMYSKGKLSVNNNSRADVQYSRTDRQNDEDASAALVVGAIIGLGVLSAFDDDYDDDCDCW
jgi:TPR repeat protein